MCRWGITRALKIDGKYKDIDDCLFNLVKVLNDNGFETIACCCGHGKQPPRISLKDGRELLIFDYKTAQKICKQFPPIN